MQRIEFPAMGSHIVAAVDCETAPAAMESLPGCFEAWEQALSRFRYDSELCTINRRAGTPTPVSQVVWNVFQAAQEADARTGGLVNPLITDALISAGYDRTFEQLNGAELDEDLYSRARVPDLNEIVSDSATRTLCLPTGSQLDFGGIAKGWAAQQAMLALAPYGPALVGAGGDIAMSGPRADGEPWQIAVDDPFEAGGFIEDLFIERGGVATSGRDFRRWVRGGKEFHHIIDPRTAQPAETDILTATVVAESAMLAEAVAKAVLIIGSAAGLEWLDSGDSMAGLLVLEDGRRLYSRNLERYL